jgi:hypothetical protein
MSSNQQNIIPKDCSYQCGTRIYWSTADNSFLEVFSKQKHICKNRSVNRPSGNLPQGNTSNTNRPFYSKKPWPQKVKMSNSLELLLGPVSEVQKKYEVLSDIVSEYNGKVHGSQSHILPNNTISLVVYYEVPAEGNVREMVKQKFNNYRLFIPNYSLYLKL